VKSNTQEDAMEYNPPNTRERVTARRQSNRQRRAGGELPAQPGLRRRLLAGITSGRLFSLIVFLVCFGTMAVILTDPRFVVRDVRIDGLQVLQREQVLELAGIQDRSIWFVDSEAVIARLEADSYIETAAIELQAPDQAVVRLVERRPQVRWMAGGVAYMIDADGVVIGPAEGVTEEQVLVITDEHHLQLQPDDTVDVDALHLARLLAVRLPSEVGVTPLAMAWDLERGVSIRSESGQRIVFGRSDNLDRKLAVYRYLLEDQTVFTNLDLRFATPFYHNNADVDEAE
jgi:cell division protein FtsQ